MKFDYFTKKAVSKKRKSFAASVTESPPMFPSECRERGITYKGSISASLTWRVNEKLKGRSKHQAVSDESLK